LPRSTQPLRAYNAASRPSAKGLPRAACRMAGAAAYVAAAHVAAARSESLVL